MFSKRLFLAFTLLSCSFFACDRRTKQIAGVQKPKSAPSYSVNPSRSELAKAAHVEEVAPKVAGALDGAALYAANCSACHQLTGQGVPGAFPPLDASEYVLSDKVDRMAAIMLYGLSGPITVKGQPYNSAMAPLGGTLKDEELAAIATYVRSAWSNKAGAVESKIFADARAKWVARGPFTIEELGAE